jgi:putative heme iron utilization protein
LREADRVAESAAVINERLEMAPEDVSELIHAAEEFAACATCVKERNADHAEAVKYGDRAMALVQKAVAKGYVDARHLREDADFDVIFERAEFQRLLREIDEKRKP